MLEQHRVEHPGAPADRVVAVGRHSPDRIGDPRQPVGRVIGVAGDVALGVGRGCELPRRGVGRAGRAQHRAILKSTSSFTNYCHPQVLCKIGVFL